MTSKPSSTDALIEVLTDALITRAHNEIVGPMTLNVTDGLFAIATAINRLADNQKHMQAAMEQRRVEIDQLYEMMGRRDGEGHA